ncbi:MAG: LpxD N-terminal domain-containing protein, partial [Sulfuricurvum sp.]|nr:LpxD N-terminal domain-containing protein [Sulfuricurvum sp.]
MTLNEIAQYLEIELSTFQSIEITGINTLKDAVGGEISFLSDSKYEKDLENTQATAVILPSSKAHLLPKNTIPLVSDEAYLMVAKLSKIFAKPIQSSTIAPIIGEKSIIYPTAHIENGARLGSGCIIMSGVYIGTDVVLGDNVILNPNVSVYRDCTIGNNVIVHAGSVIGSDGFGYAHTKMGEHIKLYQNGNVIIEEDVEIGANTT